MDDETARKVAFAQANAVAANFMTVGVMRVLLERGAVTPDELTGVLTYALSGVERFSNELPLTIRDEVLDTFSELTAHLDVPLDRVQ